MVEIIAELSEEKYKSSKSVDDLPKEGLPQRRSILKKSPILSERVKVKRHARVKGFNDSEIDRSAERNFLDYETVSSDDSTTTDSDLKSFVSHERIGDAQLKGQFFHIIGGVPRFSEFELQLKERSRRSSVYQRKSDLNLDQTEDFSIEESGTELEGDVDGEEEFITSSGAQYPDITEIYEISSSEDSELEQQLLSCDKTLDSLDKHENEREQVMSQQREYLTLFQELLDRKTVVIHDSTERIQHEYFLSAIVERVLNDLLDKVAQIVEYDDPRDEQRKKFDKRKLLTELIDKFGHLEVETDYYKSLSKAAIQFYYRNKHFRHFKDDSDNKLIKTIYREAINQLDMLMVRERELRAISQLRIDNLKEKLATLESNEKMEYEEMENLIRTTLTGDRKRCRVAVVDRGLAEMSQCRNQMILVRRILISHLDTLATLREKINKMEDLGNGLRISNLEHLTNINYILDAKIAERNSDLYRLHRHDTSDTHIFVHMQERCSMLEEILHNEKSALDELLDKRERLRILQHNLKSKRAQLRKEIMEIRFQGGLVSRHALMIDYDETVVLADRTRQRIGGLIEKFHNLTKKIEAIELERTSR